MSQDVAKTESSRNPVFASKRAMLDNEATLDGDAGLREWQQGKIAAILEAGTFEEINALMTETGLTPASDLVGHRLEILDFAIRESADQYRGNGSQLEKVGYVKAVESSTGEQLMIDGGGDLFVTGLVAMRDRYGFPFTGTIVGLTTGSGRTLHTWLFEDPKRATIS